MGEIVGSVASPARYYGHIYALIQNPVSPHESLQSSALFLTDPTKLNTLLTFGGLRHTGTLALRQSTPRLWHVTTLAVGTR